MPVRAIISAIPGMLVALPLQFVPAGKARHPERFSFFAWIRRRRPRLRREIGAMECECSVLAFYQMGCFAQQMSVGGFDIGTAQRCSCERSRDRCVERMR